MKKHYRKENNCLNCGAELQGKFCHVCGQENLQVKESFYHMMNHLISDYFHFDHQFFHTLKPLLFEPGKLTNEYMAGRRVQYLHPVKMYIFISFIYFLLLFNQHNVREVIQPKQITKEQAATPQKDNHQELVDNNNDKILLGKNRDTTYQLYLISQQKLPIEKRDSFLGRYIHKKYFNAKESKVDYEKLISESIKHYFPKMMFLLLPLFALILMTAFWRNKKFYVEHLIYSLHLHCFFFLSITVIMLSQIVIPDSMSILSSLLNYLAIVIIPWYFYKSLRVMYNRSPTKTIFKMLAVTFNYTIVLSFCMLLLIIVISAFEL